MLKICDIEIDESIVLPESCDNMPEDLRGHLLAALSDACKRLECSYNDLVWSVKIDPKSKQPYFKVKKRD